MQKMFLASELSVIPDPVLSADGRRWLWPDGTVLPRVSGGATGDGDGGSGGGGGSGAGGDGGDGQGGAGDGSSGGNNDSGGGGGFTPPASQAELDALVAKGVTERFDAEFGKRKTKWEGDVKTFLEAEGKKAGMEGDAAELVAQAEQKADEKQQAADKRVIATEAKVAAIEAGAKPDRVGALLKLSDLSKVEVGDSGDPDPEALKAAVTKALTENPEFKAGQNGSPAGSSGGDFNTGGNEHIFTRAEIKAMSQADYEKNEEQILAQTAKGLIK